MSKITLRKAVELLHKDGDPIDVAVIRIRRVAAIGHLRSWGLAVGWESSGPLGEYFELEQIITSYTWNNGARVDWEHSTIEMSKPYEWDEESGCFYMYFCRIVLNRDDFDRAFFPDKAKPAVERPIERKPSISISEVKNWLDREYNGKARPGVHEMRAAAKAYDPRIKRDLLTIAATAKWPEPRRRGRPSGTDNVPENTRKNVQG